MTAFPHILLDEPSLSLKLDKLAHVWANVENLLIIQDLDGVCMGLVKDPLTRTIDPAYIQAVRSFDGHFYVLTNGEHIGQRGVNSIVESALGDPALAQTQGLYLSGLAAGGVQWQDRYGSITHPGVSDAELQFLETVPQRIKDRLRQFFNSHPAALAPATLAACIEASALDNLASPTANLNTFHDHLQHRPDLYHALQQDMQTFMDGLLQDAAQQGLQDCFFVHYAPNLGRNDQGAEILWPAQGSESGTTDFQFMIQGAIKEAGVLAILNHYYYRRTGTYPLGQTFSARTAPRQHQELLQLVKNQFEPQHMPVMVGVGDTVTSRVETDNGQLKSRRGGSDRNFLQLIQDIGLAFNKGNIVVYIDSSQGEVKNRKPLKLGTADSNATPPGEDSAELVVLEGPGDSRDVDDPLTLNVVFPGGHQQYVTFFQEAARARQVQQVP